MAQINKILLFLFAVFSICLFPLYSQSPSQKQELRIMMWAELDEFPGLFGDEEAYRPSIRQSDEEDISALPDEKKSKVEKKASQGLSGEKESDRQKLFGFAIARMKEITPFLLNGMINGWTFDYTPLDRARHVEEFYEFGEVRPFDGGLNPI